MYAKAFEPGDRVRIADSGFSSGPANFSGIIGTVRSVDKSRRRTEPYYIYFVEMPGEDRLVDFEYRELEFVSSAGNEVKENTL